MATLAYLQPFGPVEHFPLVGLAKRKDIYFSHD